MGGTATGTATATEKQTNLEETARIMTGSETVAKIVIKSGNASEHGKKIEKEKKRKEIKKRSANVTRSVPEEMRTAIEIVKEVASGKGKETGVESRTRASGTTR